MTANVHSLPIRLDLALRQRDDARREVKFFNQRITELEAENAKLRAELAASLLPYQGHESHVVDDRLVIVLHSGVVYEMVERDHYSATETVLGKRAFRRLPSVPGSVAARVDAIAEQPAPGGFGLTVCAYSPCRREFDPRKVNEGVYCSRACMIRELEEPGTFAPSVALGDDDARFSA